MELDKLPLLEEIRVEEISYAGYCLDPPMLTLEIVRIERGVTPSRVVIQFEGKAQASILEVVEEILTLTGKVNTLPNRPKASQ